MAICLPVRCTTCDLQMSMHAFDPKSCSVMPASCHLFFGVHFFRSFTFPSFYSSIRLQLWIGQSNFNINKVSFTIRGIFYQRYYIVPSTHIKDDWSEKTMELTFLILTHIFETLIHKSNKSTFIYTQLDYLDMGFAQITKWSLQMTLSLDWVSKTPEEEG